MNKIKQKTYLNIAIFSSIVIAIFYVGNFYLVEAVKGLSLEIIDKKQKIERLNKQSDQINSIRTGYEYIQKETNKVSDLIVNYPDIIDFIIEVESVAEKNGVDLNVSVSNKDGGSLSDNLSFVGYSVKAAGDFDNVMHFLVYLENLRYLNKIENIRMYYSSESKNDPVDLYKTDSSEIVLNANLKVYIKNKDLK